MYRTVLRATLAIALVTALVAAGTGSAAAGCQKYDPDCESHSDNDDGDTAVDSADKYNTGFDPRNMASCACNYFLNGG